MGHDAPFHLRYNFAHQQAFPDVPTGRWNFGACRLVKGTCLSESLLPYLAGIVVLGVAAQWLAWRVGLPSILLLLVLGIIAGPAVTSWLDPDAVFGDLLFPVVSLSVALILYEGGLSLRLRELKSSGAVVRNLVSVGALLTWAGAALAAYIILQLSLALSILLGAVLVVTGPTVISPLLRTIRPTGPVGPILKWEGVVIDPIGALLAVLVFEAMVIGVASDAAAYIVVAVAKTAVVGGGLGMAAALLFVLLSHRRWISDHLENPVSLMLVVAVFSLSNHLQHESGLLAVIVMGFVLANQRWVDVEHLIEFKENLRVLLISSLFIVLAARVDAADLVRLAPAGLLFVAGLVFVVRPASVWVSTIGSRLSMSERVFLAWMAPRGLVAAAVSSIFAIRLEALGLADAGVLVPMTFITIIATITVYGLSAPIAARKLGLAEANPQGILFVGAQNWVKELAGVLQREGFRVLLVDNNRDHTYDARMAGLPTFAGSILAEHTLDEIDLGGIGRVLAVTPNDWVNVLTVQRFHRVFGKANCFQLPPQPSRGGHAKPSKQEDSPYKYLQGRWLFDQRATHSALERRVEEGYAAKATRLTEEFDYAALLARYGSDVIPLFVIEPGNRLTPVEPPKDAADTSNEPAKPGQTLVSLVRPETTTDKREE